MFQCCDSPVTCCSNDCSCDEVADEVADEAEVEGFEVALEEAMKTYSAVDESMDPQPPVTDENPEVEDFEDDLETVVKEIDDTVKEILPPPVSSVNLKTITQEEVPEIVDELITVLVPKVNLEAPTVPEPTVVPTVPEPAVDPTVPEPVVVPVPIKPEEVTEIVTEFFEELVPEVKEGVPVVAPTCEKVEKAAKEFCDLPAWLMPPTPEVVEEVIDKFLD